MSGPAPREKVKIRALARIASVFFAVWGASVAAKAVYDLFWGEPESNRYAPAKWAFVTLAEWLRYAGFELVYGLACLSLAWGLWRYSRFLPRVIERPRRAPILDLFE